MYGLTRPAAFVLAAALVAALILLLRFARTEPRDVLATRAGVPAQVVGFTLIALGTSLPELLTSIQAQRRGDSDLLVGNLLASNLVNSLAGGAVIALSTDGTAFAFSPALIVAMVATSVVAWAFLSRRKRLSRPESVLLLLFYLALLPLIS